MRIGLRPRGKNIAIPRGEDEGDRKEQEFVFPFEKLEVWQRSVDLADYNLELLEAFPTNKYLRLVGQMEAAVAGIPRNIAEGKGRQ